MNKLKITLVITLLPCFLSAQNYLSREREDEIRNSEKYYYDDCADLDADKARSCALQKLTSRIIADAVNLSYRQEEVLKELEMNAHFDNLQQEGRIEILAWIAKDSVFVITKKPITQHPKPTPPMSVQPIAQEEEPATPPTVSQPLPKQEINSVTTDNPILQELAACKTYKEVKRAAIINGLVTGDIGQGSNGFSNPEKCIIAVFAIDGTLAALLDSGGNMRTDLLSGKTVQNPELQYKGEQYFLWYMQRK